MKNAAPLTTGLASTPASHRPTGEASAMATHRRIGFGSPSNIGATGAPSHRSGGATDIRRRCCVM
jgi:hypothetical protein